MAICKTTPSRIQACNVDQPTKKKQKQKKNPEEIYRLMSITVSTNLDRKCRSNLIWNFKIRISSFGSFQKTVHVSSEENHAANDKDLPSSFAAQSIFNVPLQQPLQKPLHFHGHGVRQLNALCHTHTKTQCINNSVIQSSQAKYQP